MRRTLAGLGALSLVVLGGVGWPALLYVITGEVRRFLPDLGDPLSLLARPDSGGLFLAMVLLLGWAAWLLWVLALVVEVWAQVRGVSTPRLGGLFPQRSAARTVTAIAVLLASVPALWAQPAAADSRSEVVPGRAGQVAAGAVHPAAADHGLRSDGSGSAAGRAFETTAAASQAGGKRAGDRTERYVVKPGDTLWEISGRELDDPRRYPEIARATARITQPDGLRLTDPDLIHPGWRLEIPDSQGEQPDGRSRTEGSPDSGLDRGLGRDEPDAGDGRKAGGPAPDVPTDAPPTGTIDRGTGAATPGPVAGPTRPAGGHPAPPDVPQAGRGQGANADDGATADSGRAAPTSAASPSAPGAARDTGPAASPSTDLSSPAPGLDRGGPGSGAPTSAAGEPAAGDPPSLDRGGDPHTEITSQGLPVTPHQPDPQEPVAAPDAPPIGAGLPELDRGSSPQAAPGRTALDEATQGASDASGAAAPMATAPDSRGTVEPAATLPGAPVSGQRAQGAPPADAGPPPSTETPGAVTREIETANPVPLPTTPMQPVPAHGVDGLPEWIAAPLIPTSGG